MTAVYKSFFLKNGIDCYVNMFFLLFCVSINELEKLNSPILNIIISLVQKQASDE